MSESVRYVVESIAPPGRQFFRDIAIREGDTIEFPDGFPSARDLPESGEPATLFRELHPSVSWFLGSAAKDGTVVLRRATSN